MRVQPDGDICAGVREREGKRSGASLGITHGDFCLCIAAFSIGDLQVDLVFSVRHGLLDRSRVGIQCHGHRSVLDDDLCGLFKIRGGHGDGVFVRLIH